MLMIEKFQIRDIFLLDNIFEEIGKEAGTESCTLSHFIERLTMHLEGPFDYKLTIIMEAYCVLSNVTEVPHQKVIDLIDFHFGLVYKAFENAKDTIREMGFKSEKFLDLNTIVGYLNINPDKLDVISRLTLGPYHPPKEKGGMLNNKGVPAMAPNHKLIQALRTNNRRKNELVLR